ncbi:hypothetical protein HanRHA438_Chr02g0090921 [Helianthus annuus]|nr:hypothetical protein HanRHA438_Chr02g0090921 [Helianthus annuus]
MVKLVVSYMLVFCLTLVVLPCYNCKVRPIISRKNVNDFKAIGIETHQTAAPKNCDKLMCFPWSPLDSCCCTDERKCFPHDKCNKKNCPS